MEHVFQVECWETDPSGCSFGLLWLREIGKGKVAIIGILFMK